jgi:DNA-binding HxlR family transcriptional regulator
VLASRLKTLTAAGVMRRVAGERHLEYELTAMGTALWPHRLLEPLRAAAAPASP